MSYEVIGQGSKHEVYILHGVNGAILALVDYYSYEPQQYRAMILAIKKDSDNNIQHNFVSEDNSWAHHRLIPDWGWNGNRECGYPELSKYRAYYVLPPNQGQSVTERVERYFQTIKDIYDRNTNKTFRSVLSRTVAGLI